MRRKMEGAKAGKKTDQMNENDFDKVFLKDD